MERTGSEKEEQERKSMWRYVNGSEKGNKDRRGGRGGRRHNEMCSKDRKGKVENCRSLCKLRYGEEVEGDKRVDGRKRGG